MHNFFENLLDVDPIRLATKFNVIVHLDIEKTSEDQYSIDCLYNSQENFDLPTVLFQISSENLNPIEFKNQLFAELDKIRRCPRCSKIYVNKNLKNQENPEICDCPTCELELDYIKSSGETFSFECGLCNQTYWKYYSKKGQCCKCPRLCIGCCSKVIEMGFCCYCKAPVDITDFI